MRASSDELQGVLASKVIHLNKLCPEVGWDKAYAYAQQIDMWALHSLEQRFRTKGTDDIDSPAETRVARGDFQFAYFLPSQGRFTVDDTQEIDAPGKLLQGSLVIDAEHYGYIAESIQEVLAYHFKEEMSQLASEARKFNTATRFAGLMASPAGDEHPELVSGPDWLDWLEQEKAELVLDKVRQFVRPDNFGWLSRLIVADATESGEHDAGGDKEVLTIEPRNFEPLLDEIATLRNRKIDIPALPIGARPLRWSCKTEALALLARKLDFRDHDFTSAFRRIATLANGLQEEERHHVNQTLWPSCRAFLARSEKNRAGTDVPDQEEISAAFDAVMSVMEGLDTIVETPCPSETESLASGVPRSRANSLGIESSSSGESARSGLVRSPVMSGALRPPPEPQREPDSSPELPASESTSAVSSFESDLAFTPLRPPPPDSTVGLVVRSRITDDVPPPPRRAATLLPPFRRVTSTERRLIEEARKLNSARFNRMNVDAVLVTLDGLAGRLADADILAAKERVRQVRLHLLDERDSGSPAA